MTQRNTNVKRRFAAALAIVLLLALFSSCTDAQKAGETPTDPGTTHQENNPDVSPDVYVSAVSEKWQFDYTDKPASLALRASGSGTLGQKIDLCLTRSPSETGREECELFTVLYGQWCYSIVFFDAESQFALFPPEIVASQFTAQITPRGLTYEQALANIAENARILLPFRDVAISFSMTECRPLTPEEEEIWHVTGLDSRFGKAGLDPERITDSRLCEFLISEIRIGDDLKVVIGTPEPMRLYFYCYDGVWYPSPEKIEDDLTVDFALADPENKHGFYLDADGSGQVEWIRGPYARVGDSVVYMDEATVRGDFAVGDTVAFTAYDFSMTVEEIADENGAVLTCRRATSISRVEIPPNDPTD